MNDPEIESATTIREEDTEDAERVVGEMFAKRFHEALKREADEQVGAMLRGDRLPGSSDPCGIFHDPSGRDDA